MKPFPDIGALIRAYYYNYYKKEPPTPYSNYEGPFCRHWKVIHPPSLGWSLVGRGGLLAAVLGLRLPGFCAVKIF